MSESEDDLKSRQRDSLLIIFSVTFAFLILPNNAAAAFAKGSKYIQAIELAGKQKYSQAIKILQQHITEDSSFTPAYCRLAEFYRYANKLDEGQTYFQDAINQSPENPNFYLGAALIAEWSSDWKGTFDNAKSSLTKGFVSPEALELLVQSALKLEVTSQLPKIFQKLKRIKSQRHLYNLAYAIWRYHLKKFKKAQTTLRQYLKTYQQDWFGYYYLGRVSYELRDFEAALANFHKALQIIGQKDPYQRLLVLKNLGSIYQETGKLDLSEDHLDQALGLAQSMGALEEQIKIQQARSILYMKEGLYQRMADVCLNGIVLARAMNEMSALSSLYYNLAYAYRQMGDTDDALNYYLLAIEQATGLRDSELLTKAYTEIGQEYLTLRNWEKASQFLNKSIQLAQEAKLTELEHYALLSLADVHKGQGDIKSASQDYKKVLKYAQRTQNHNLTEICFLKLASLYLEPNSNLRNAKYYLSLADALARQTLTLQFTATHRWMQGKISLFEGNVENAETLFLDAIQLGKESGSYASILAGHAGLINSYLSARCADLAAAQSDSALKCLNGFENLYDREITSEFFNVGKELFFPAVSAFSELGDLVRAYKFCEQYKALMHWNNISPVNFKIKASLPDSIKWKYDKISTRIIDHWSELRESWRKDARDNLDRVMSIKEDIRQLHARRKAAISELAENYPGYFALVHPQGESLSNLQDVLRPTDASFLHYLVGEDATIIIIVRPDTVYSQLVNVSSSFLRMLVEQMSPLFSQSSSDFMLATESEEPAFRLDVAGQLYQIIFEPIEGLIPTQSPLIISPDNVLNRFPFECLVTNLKEFADDFDYVRAHFLVEDYKISYVPYAKMLNWPTFRKRRSKKTILAFANPDYHLTGLEDYRNSQNNNNVHGNNNNNLLLKPSNFSEYEITQITQLFRKQKAKIYSGPDATKARFLQESPKYHNIHLALPGILDDAQSLYSKLYFSNQSGLNEILKTYELFNLKLNADLVVLSDLRRESKTLNMGESVNGMVHGFIYAGVASVVTSLWRTDHKESSVLLDNFYSNLKLGMKKSEALQQAKVQYLKTGNRNPYYWASFVLYGNPEPMNIDSQNMDNLFPITIFGFMFLLALAVWQIFKIRNEKRL